MNIILRKPLAFIVVAVLGSVVSLAFIGIVAAHADTAGSWNGYGNTYSNTYSQVFHSGHHHHHHHLHIRHLH